jgi:hypothetical protein
MSTSLSADRAPKLVRLMCFRCVSALLALLVTTLVAASAASAHGATPWFGTYQVSVVGGSQDTTWTLNHVATSGCDVSSTGQGSDDQDFLTGGPQTVQFSGVGATAFPATIMGLALNYTENREGSITTSEPTGANTAECPGASGGGGEAPPTPDCGTRSLSTSVDVDPSPSSPSVTQSLSADMTSEPPYKDCPVSGQVVPAFASPLVATLPPLGPTLDGGVPSGRATLQATEPITEQDVSGQTTLKLELQFTRLLVVDAMGLPADVTLAVSAGGSTTVPIECPAGSCSGTVGLELGGVASDSSFGHAVAAVATPRFPAPVTVAEPVIASAHFHLKAGHRGVQLHLPGGRRFARSIASTPFDVVVTQGSGKDTLRYVAGQGHLRA